MSFTVPQPATVVQVRRAGPAAHLRLYRNALESIFSFFDLRELHTITSVCREWSAAACSMKSIDSTVEKLPGYGVSRLEASRLARRHIAVLCKHGSSYSVYLSLNLLQRLVNMLSHLREVQCKLAMDQQPLQLLVAPHLQQLSMDLIFESASMDILQCIRMLPQLTVLRLRIDGLEALNFSHLQTLPMLREFHLSGNHLSNQLVREWRLNQLDQLLLSPQLETVDVQSSNGKHWLPLLLERPQHCLRWQHVGNVQLRSDSLLPILSGLVTLRFLTNIDLTLSNCTIEDFNFLSGYSDRLRSLKLSIHGDAVTRAVTSNALVVSFTGGPHYAHLSKLLLQGLTYSSETLSRLLVFLPELSDLTLVQFTEVQSLAFLATPALQKNLKKLCLYHLSDRGGHDFLRLPADDIQHVHTLHALEEASFINIFRPLSEVQAATLLPHSAHMPRLKKCDCVY
jgi:hypothetical protein